MADFWNAWQDLAGNPGGIPERSALLQKAEALATQFRSMSADLNQVRQSMNTNLGASILELNQTAHQIASLNEKIVASESDGTTANDLRDQRNNLVEKMASLIGINYYEDNNGSLTIPTTNGKLLVNGTILEIEPGGGKDLLERNSHGSKRPTYRRENRGLAGYPG